MADYSIFSSDIKKSKGRMFCEIKKMLMILFYARDRIESQERFRRLKYKNSKCSLII